MKLPDSLPFPLIRLYNPTTIFRTLDFSKLPIFQTNSASFPENLLSVSRTLTIQEPTKTGFSHLYYWNSIQQVAGRRFQAVQFITKRVKNLSFTSQRSYIALFTHYQESLQASQRRVSGWKEARAQQPLSQRSKLLMFCFFHCGPLLQ